MYKKQQQQERNGYNDQKNTFKSSSSVEIENERESVRGLKNINVYLFVVIIVVLVLFESIYLKLNL